MIVCCRFPIVDSRSAYPVLYIPHVIYNRQPSECVEIYESPPSPLSRWLSSRKKTGTKWDLMSKSFRWGCRSLETSMTHILLFFLVFSWYPFFSWDWHHTILCPPCRSDRILFNNIYLSSLYSWDGGGPSIIHRLYVLRVAHHWYRIISLME